MRVTQYYKTTKSIRDHLADSALIVVGCLFMMSGPILAAFGVIGN